jgi:hypothetical protein
MKTLLMGALCVLSGFGEEQPVRELSTRAIPFADSIAPWFRHGHLILFPQGGPAGTPLASMAYGFTAYGPDGQFAYQKILELPGGSQPVVRDIDFDMNGNAAVAVAASGGPSGFLKGILLLDRAGRETGFIDTGRYGAAHIAIASDRTIWTLGWQLDADHAPYPDRQDYMIVRHFSADGKEVKADLPRSVFPAGLQAIKAVSELSAVGTRRGW